MNYNNYKKEELIKIIQQLEIDLENKKYGLVWDKEREPEQVVLDCQYNLPILKIFSFSASAVSWFTIKIIAIKEI